MPKQRQVSSYVRYVLQGREAGVSAKWCDVIGSHTPLTKSSVLSHLAIARSRLSSNDEDNHYGTKHVRFRVIQRVSVDLAVNLEDLDDG